MSRARVQTQSPTPGPALRITILFSICIVCLFVCFWGGAEVTLYWTPALSTSLVSFNLHNNPVKHNYLYFSEEKTHRVICPVTLPVGAVSHSMALVLARTTLCLQYSMYKPFLIFQEWLSNMCSYFCLGLITLNFPENILCCN